MREPKSKIWVEVSKENLLHNLSSFRKLVGDNVNIAGVVKANAYGHGLVEVVKAIVEKVDYLAVDNINEALTVRKFGIKKPILVLGYILPGDFKAALENDISFVVYNCATLKKIVSLSSKKKASVHLKVETGFGRQGLKMDGVLELLNLIEKNKNKIIVEGLSSHFAVADENEGQSFTERQIKYFDTVYEEAQKRGFFPLRHLSATAGTIMFPVCRFDMVRIGIGLYGMYPSKYVRKVSKLRLKPAITWKTVVAQVKFLQKGDSVGYGRTYVAKKKTKIAILPVGYWDGYDRGFSNNAHVLIKGRKAQVIGRVAMNMVAVDVTRIGSVSVGDEVILLGKTITAEDLAKRIGTMNYEITTRINPLLPRIVV